MPGQNTIFDQLRTDHREVDQILNGLIGNERQVDNTNVRKLCDMLEVHMQIEEDHLYPKAEQEEEVTRLIKESYDEHQKLKDRISQLRQGGEGMETSRYSQVLREIQQYFQHHRGEEENQMFPYLEKTWDQNTIERLGNRMLESRQHLMAGRK